MNAEIIKQGEELECFTFWKSFLIAIENCPKKSQLELFKAITKFAFLGEDSASFSSKTAMVAWVSIKQIIAKNRVNALNRKGKQKNESITNQ